MDKDEKYKKLGEEKGLTLVGYAPGTVREPAIWVCNTCGREHTKTYRAVKYAEHGCVCYKTLNENDYKNLADELGIIWIGKTVPLTNKEITQWETDEGDKIHASYHQLAYGNGKRLKERYGIRNDN